MAYQDEVYRKMPFYMAYPMQNLYLTELEYEKDLDRMKAYYPAETKEIMTLVEKRLDQLEYEGSRIYDEEPDLLMMQMEADGIYRQLAGTPSKEAQVLSCFDSVPEMIAGARGAAAQECCGAEPWLRSVVGVLFGAELCRRRCRYRRRRRWL